MFLRISVKAGGVVCWECEGRWLRRLCGAINLPHAIANQRPEGRWLRKMRTGTIPHLSQPTSLPVRCGDCVSPRPRVVVQPVVAPALPSPMAVLFRVRIPFGLSERELLPWHAQGRWVRTLRIRGESAPRATNVPVDRRLRSRPPEPDPDPARFLPRTAHSAHLGLRAWYRACPPIHGSPCIGRGDTYDKLVYRHA